MGYLLDLVKSLNNDELKRFIAIELSGKEAAVRDAYAATAGLSDFNEALLPVKLSLSQSHFDKITSVLLDKTLQLFAPGGLESKMDFCVEKHLTPLLVHELKLTEKRLKKNGTKQEQLHFYRTAFLTYSRFSYNVFDEKMLRYYAYAYTGLLGKNEGNEKYSYLAKMEEGVARYHSLRQTHEVSKKNALKQLNLWLAEVKGKNWHKAEMCIYTAYSACYEVDDAETSLNYMLKAEEAARKIYHTLEDRQKTFLLLMKALLLIDLNRFEEAIATYETALREFHALLQGRMFHTYNYCYALMLAGHYKRASVAIDKYLNPFLSNENARNFHFDILRLYLMLALLTNDLKDAAHYVQRVMQMPKEDFTPFGDGVFRYVHNIYIAQTGDYEMAASLVKKNLKFMKAKMEISGFDNLIRLLTELNSVLRIKRNILLEKNTAPSVELESMDGKTFLYARLLENFMGLKPAVGITRAPQS